MIRKQMYIGEELDRELKRLAASSEKPEAFHVRAALEIYLERHRPPVDDDPLERLIALVPNEYGPTDGAVNHDHYLYDRR